MPQRPSSPARPDRRPSTAGQGARRSEAIPSALFATLHEALQRAVAALNTAQPGTPITTTLVSDDGETDYKTSRPSPNPPPHSEASRTQVLRVDGPNGSVRVRFAVSPLSSGLSSDAPIPSPYAVKVGIEAGPVVRYTTPGPTPAPAPSATGEAPPISRLTLLRHKAESFLKQELRQRLAVTSSSTRAPRLVLDAEGRIQALSSAARTALEYPPDADPANPNFFSHVAGCSLGQVLRDLARMVNDDYQRVRWLVRLHTGTGRWRWYRAVATNHLSDDGSITITIWPLSPTRTAHDDPAQSS